MGPAGTFVAAVALVLVHMLLLRVVRLSDAPRSIWLSFAGGVSVAYVFLHLVPQLASRQRSWDPPIAIVEHPVYFVALAGLVVFYGLEGAVRSRHERGAGEAAPIGVFWLHVGSFALYNAMIGYLLVVGESGSVEELVTYVVAIGLHFVVNDHHLRMRHRSRYDRFGRWILSVAVLVGWGLAMAPVLPEAAVSVVLAFLAGGIILNALKEELPTERESRLPAFVAGAVAYSILLAI